MAEKDFEKPKELIKQKEMSADVAHAEVESALKQGYVYSSDKGSAKAYLPDMEIADLKDQKAAIIKKEKEAQLDGGIKGQDDNGNPKGIIKSVAELEQARFDNYVKEHFHDLDRNHNQELDKPEAIRAWQAIKREDEHVRQLKLDKEKENHGFWSSLEHMFTGHY